MPAEAFQISFDGIPDVLGRLSAGSPLGNTPRQGWAGRHEHSVFVLFQIHAILHHPTILTKPAPIDLIRAGPGHKVLNLRE